jgi:S1-C subfamily serine protease
MTRRDLKNALVVLAGLALAALGVYNLVLKATWTLTDDGVHWRQAPQGLVASRLAPGGPGARAGVRAGDVLLAVDGEEVLRRSGGPSTSS